MDGLLGAGKFAAIILTLPLLLAPLLGKIFGNILPRR